MDFDQRVHQIRLTYDLLKRFVRGGLRMTWDEPEQNADHGEMNIIVLRGAKPVSGFGADPPGTQEEIQEQLTWQSQRNDEPIIRLANNVHDEYNDVILFAWKDSRGNSHVRAFLGSTDPGSNSYQRLQRGERDRLVANIGAGQHKATWAWHKTGRALHSRVYYEGLNISTPGENGTRVFRRWDPDNPNSRRQFQVAEGIQLHGGGYPPNDVDSWSDGCIVICGSGRNADGEYVTGDVYDYLMGVYSMNAAGNDLQHTTAGLLERIEGTAHSVEERTGRYQLYDFDEATEINEDFTEANLNRFPSLRNRLRSTNTNVEINFIVWNAWTLAQFYWSRVLRLGGYNYKPIVEFGSHDPPRDPNYIGPVYGWVRDMQYKLNTRISRDIQNDPNRTRIFTRFPHVILPLNLVVDGLFRPGTLDQLRAFQLVCFTLLNNDDGSLLTVDEQINTCELNWERNEWLCGPETWKLLESNAFTVTPLD